MIWRPRIRIPLWAALVIVGAAYLFRSFVLRSGDLSVDAADIVIFGVLVLAVLLVGSARRGHGGDHDRRADRPPPESNE